VGIEATGYSRWFERLLAELSIEVWIGDAAKIKTKRVRKQIENQADSVDTGSGMKNGKLKGEDFFDVEDNPVITFKSTKIVRTGHKTYQVHGDFTIRGVSNPEKLTLTVSGKGTGSSEVKGKMVFNRKDYGMNKGIPFIKIADHVEVDFHFTGERVSGPPLLDK
jgi:polyisoprenoid-binding protein YceI